MDRLAEDRARLAERLRTAYEEGAARRAVPPLTLAAQQEALADLRAFLTLLRAVYCHLAKEELGDLAPPFLADPETARRVLRRHGRAVPDEMAAVGELIAVFSYSSTIRLPADPVTLKGIRDKLALIIGTAAANLQSHYGSVEMEIAI